MAIHTLADSCVLVRMKFSKPRMSRRDRSLEQDVRQREQDESLVVSRKLFPDKSSPVHTGLSLMNSAYAAHKSMSKSWLDDGPRVLLSARIPEYQDKVRAITDKLIPIAGTIRSNWDQLVQDAVTFRGAGASVSEYPTSDDVQGMFHIEYRIRPIPTEGDFRVEVSPAAKASYLQELDEATAAIRSETLRMTLTTLRRAVERLSVPIGEEGAVFRNSLVENITDAVREVEDHNLSNDPEVTAIAAEIKQALAAFNSNPDVLRNFQQVRDDTSNRLATIADKLGDL